MLASLLGRRRRKAPQGSTGTSNAERGDAQFGRRVSLPETDTAPVKESRTAEGYRVPRSMSPPLAE